MPIPFVRARWLAPMLCLALSACGRAPQETQLVAHQAQVDPPRLWLAESFDANGAVSGKVLVCADTTLREGFGRANAEVDGRPCLALKGAVERAGLYAQRCELNGRRFGLTVTRAGDPKRDFTATFALTALDGSGIRSRQTRRYRDVGECPADWGIGDQGQPGKGRGMNALAATWGG